MENKIQTIGIIGYGRFGSFTHSLLEEIDEKLEFNLYDKSDTKINSHSHFEAAAYSDLVILAVPINEIESVCKEISALSPEDNIIIDVCSVKVYPTKIMLDVLPKSVNIMSTHPMFGPGDFENELSLTKQMSAKRWVVDAVQSNSSSRNKVFELLKKTGADIIEMSSNEHDKIAAKTQFPTLFAAFTYKALNIKHTDINTYSSDKFIELLKIITIEGSLLKDIYNYNPYCKDVLKEIETSQARLSKYLKE